MSFEDIKNEFSRRIDELIGSIESLRTVSPSKKQLSDQAELANLISELIKAKVELISTLDTYASEYRCALEEYANDQQIAFHTQYLAKAHTNVVHDDIKARKKSIEEANVLEISALTISVRFADSIKAAQQLRNNLCTEVSSFIKDFELCYDKFETPPLFLPISSTIAKYPTLSARLQTAFSMAAKKITETDKEHFSNDAHSFKNAIQDQFDKAIKDIDITIEEMQAASNLKSRQLTTRQAEEIVLSKLNREFSKITRHIKILLARISANETIDTAFAKEITELDPSIYSFSLPTDFEFCQDKVNVIADPLNKLKTSHLAYSNKLLVELNKKIKDTFNKVEKLKAKITSLVFSQMDSRPAAIRLIIKDIDALLAEINNAMLPKYACPSNQQELGKIQRQLSHLHNDLEARKYNLNIILKMHTDTELVTGRFQRNQCAANSIFARKKSPTELRGLTFDYFSSHDLPAFAAAEKKLQTLENPREFELEEHLFQQTRNELLNRVIYNKNLCASRSKHYQARKDIVLLEDVKNNILADINLSSLLKHADKIATDGEKGRIKADTIQLLKTKIENATSIYELTDIISGKSTVNAYMHSEINKSRSFFGFGKVTASIHLKAFQESAQRIINADQPARPALA